MGQAQHDGTVVAVLIILCRGENGKRRFPKCIGVTDFRVDSRIVFGFHGLNHIIIGTGIRLFFRHQNGVTVKFVDDDVGTSDMVGVRMGQYQIIKGRNAQVFQIGLHLRTLVIVSSIDEHGVRTLGQKGTVALSNIQKMDGQVFRHFCRCIGGLHTCFGSQI